MKDRRGFVRMMRLDDGEKFFTIWSVEGWTDWGINFSCSWDEVDNAAMDKVNALKTNNKPEPYVPNKGRWKGSTSIPKRVDGVDVDPFRLPLFGMYGSGIELEWIELLACMVYQMYAWVEL
jgi:hypothetical protein